MVGDANHINPIGAVGELLIGGINLGRGYINDPEKNGNCFLGQSGVDTPDLRPIATDSTERGT